MAKKWYFAGEGDNFDSLGALMADHQLQKGDRIKCQIRLNVPVGYIFDITPDLWPSVPEGMSCVNVWGSGWPVPWSVNYGYVEMEADPAWLLGVLAFMRAHWVALIIAGVVLYALVSKIWVWMFTDLGATPPPPPDDGQKWYEDIAWIAVGGGALIFIVGAGVYLSRSRTLSK